MHLTRTSPLSGNENTREIRGITEQDLRDYVASGQLIQNFFPSLSADDREFIMTGITPDEWDAMAGDE